MIPCTVHCSDPPSTAYKMNVSMSKQSTAPNYFMYLCGDKVIGLGKTLLSKKFCSNLRVFNRI